jgi:hypothetical protein
MKPMITRTTTHIIHAHTPEHTPTVRQLFIEYQQWLNFSLCFQGFDKELADLPGKYAAPKWCLYWITKVKAKATRLQHLKTAA